MFKKLIMNGKNDKIGLGRSQ